MLRVANLEYLDHIAVRISAVSARHRQLGFDGRAMKAQTQCFQAAGTRRLHCPLRYKYGLKPKSHTGRSGSCAAAGRGDTNSKTSRKLVPVRSIATRAAVSRRRIIRFEQGDPRLPFELEHFLETEQLAIERDRALEAASGDADMMKP